MPPQPIDRILRPLARFLHVEATSGIFLLLCTIAALVAANSPIAEQYLAFWETDITLAFGGLEFHHSLHHVINDGLMAIFFFVIGLEVKREIAQGSLSNLKLATLPIAAALGGMLIPAGLYLSLQYGQPGMRGWGIPMATDIAFVVGCLALLGPRVPANLRILLLSLAIVDDIGAILVIAVGYTENVDTRFILMAAFCIGIIHLFSRLGVRRFAPYVMVGALAWLALHESGIHATLTGVILGLMTPARPVLMPERFREYLLENELIRSGVWNQHKRRAEVVRKLQHWTRETVSPLEYLETALHPWTAYVIMPVFALANAGVVIDVSDIGDSVAISVILGLIVGKPLGVVLFSWLAIKTGLSRMPDGISWSILIGGSCLAGIGFTMALFIDGLAFGAIGLDTAKIGVLIGSAVSAILGMTILLAVLPRKEASNHKEAH